MTHVGGSTCCRALGLEPLHPGSYSALAFLCSPLSPHLPLPPHSPHHSSFWGEASSNIDKALALQDLILGEETVDKHPNWKGRPLQEIDLLVSVQTLGPWARWGQSGSGLIVAWPLLVTDLLFLRGQLSG